MIDSESDFPIHQRMSYARESVSSATNRPAWQVPFSLAHFWHHHRRLSGIVTTTPKRGESLEIILLFDPALHPELGQDRHHLPHRDSGELSSSTKRVYVDQDCRAATQALYSGQLRTSSATLLM